jgi:hypothetical protein
MTAHRAIRHIAAGLWMFLVASSAAAQIPGPGRSSNIGYDVGANYHATSADFVNGSFVQNYHDAGVRSIVVAQLQTMADAGATVVKTVLWQVGSSSESWQLSFPLSPQELANIGTYANDVGNTRRTDGGYLDLQLSIGWLGCADYTLVLQPGTVGYCHYSWSEFTALARESLTALVQRLAGIVRPDGRKSVGRLHLELEVMIGARENQDRFLLETYPFFMSLSSQAGLTGSIYFAATSDESDILDDAYVDSDYPVLNGHKSLFWIYRSMDFMQRNGLQLPDRLDFSFYPRPSSSGYAALVNRVMADVEAVFPGYGAAVVETYYFLDAARRHELGRAFANAYLARGLPEQVTFWTTPYTPASDNAGPPFDFAAYRLLVPGGTSDQISASPNPCTVSPPETSCSTTVTWNTYTPYGSGALWVTAGISAPMLVGCGRQGQVSIPWIQTGVVYTLRLYATPACDANTTVVTGVQVASAEVSATPGWAAPIALDKLTTHATDDGPNPSFVHTPISPAPSLVLVSVGKRRTATVLGVTYCGQPMTPVVSSDFGSRTAAIYRLQSPPAGACPVVVQTSGSAFAAVIAAHTYTGAVTTGAVQTAQGAGTSATLPALAAGSGDLVVDTILIHAAAAISPGAGQTEQWDVAGSNIRGAGSSRPGAASVVMGQSWNASADWIHVAVTLVRF